MICATNEDLPALAERGEFRADLLDRLAFDVITLPPLRERPEDILLLAEHFAIQMTRQLELELFSGFTEKARRTLMDYHWPGNVRELKNTVERSVYRHNNAQLPVHEIVLDPFDSPWRPGAAIRTRDQRPAEANPPRPSTSQPAETGAPAGANGSSVPSLPLDFRQTCQTFEVQILKQALVQSQYNQKKTAELLGLTYHQLRGILKKYDLLGNDI